jgi:hypothetical protein
MDKVYKSFGCCENCILLTLEYHLFLDKIRDKLQDTGRARIIDYPGRNKIREGIYESLIKTSNARYAAMPMVRLAMELPVLEDVGIKIMHKLNRKKRTNKIKDIIPTRNIKIELENVPLSVLKDSLLYFKNLF